MKSPSTSPSYSPSVQIVLLKDDRNFSPWNTPFAVWATRCSGSLSTVSSFTIIYIILRSKTRLSSIYHRIMFGLSIADIIGSVSTALASWPMPRHLPKEEDFEYHWAGARLGNTSTCTAQGFFATLGITCMPIYNLMLCVYYFCAIYLNMRERKIKKRVEPFLHVLPVMTGLGLACAPLAFDLYNPSMTAYAWCGPVPYPYECYLYPEEVECIRGDSKLMTVTYHAISISSAVVISLIVTILLFVIKKVIDTDRMLRQLSNRMHGRHLAFGRLQEALNFQRNSKAAIVQAAAYIATVLLGIFPSFLLSSGAVSASGSERQQQIGDALERMVLLLLPLQGFFNCIIFVSHKVYNYRRVHQNVSICKVLRLLLCTSAHDPTFISRISIVSHHEKVTREAFRDDGFDMVDIKSNKDNAAEMCDIEISDEDERHQNFRLTLMHRCNSPKYDGDTSSDMHFNFKDKAMQSNQEEKSKAPSPTHNARRNPTVGSLDLESDDMLSYPSRSTTNDGMFSLDESVLQKEEPRKSYYRYK